MIDRQHDDRERALHRGVLVKIVDHNLRISVALELDDDARVFVGFVTNRRDLAQNFFVHEIGDTLNQRSAIHIVWNLRDDDLLFAALDFFNAGFAAHFHAAAPGGKILLHARETADRAAGREIRTLHVLH